MIEYTTPHTGPRRMRFGPDGILWIPSFDEGKLMRFDPKTTKFESIDLPVLSKGEYEMPYALAVHQKTGDVWIAANNTDRVLRYLPREQRFIAYPMPNRVIWFRDIDFTQRRQGVHEQLQPAGVRARRPGAGVHLHRARAERGLRDLTRCARG